MIIDQVMRPKPPKPSNKTALQKIRQKGTRLASPKFLVVTLVASLLFVFGWQYQKARQEIKRLSQSQSAASQETDKLMEKVGRLAELPPNETPTIATVSDLAKLKDQIFFKNAKQDDKVLIFSNTKRALLYRPSINKIIEFAPLVTDVSQKGTN